MVSKKRGAYTAYGYVRKVALSYRLINRCSSPRGEPLARAQISKNRLDVVEPLRHRRAARPWRC